MKLIRSFLLPLLLCITCSGFGLSEIIENFESNTARSKATNGILSIKLQNCENNMKTIKFGDLYFDVLLLIFNDLNPLDLVNMAKTNSRNNYIARESFHQKYRNYELSLLRGHHVDQNKLREDVQSETIKIVDYKTGLDIFTIFSGLFSKLHVSSSYIQDNNSIEINRIIAKMSNILTHLNLGSVKEKTLEQFTVPFINVEEFTCFFFVKRISFKIKPLAQLLPNVQRMSIALDSDLDYKFIDCEFPHLNQLTIKINNMDFNGRKLRFEGLLRKNPQLKSLTISGRDDQTNSYLRAISEHSLNIENLTFDGGFTFNAYDETVLQFASVKQLKLGNTDNTHMYLLSNSFPQLETIDFLLPERYFNEWSQFLESYKNLRKITVRPDIRISDTMLTQIAMQLPNLVEMTWSNTNVALRIEAIGAIIRSHLQIKKFEIILWQNSAIDVLYERFANDWHITRFQKANNDNIVLEKKDEINE